jgi:succinate-semialdehyde dehydrogenase/glutarate-semialdehyde dehydrogenase
MIPGDPTDPATQIGPMNNETQYAKVVEQLEDAVSRGARVETGGAVEVAGLPGKFLAPAILTGVDHSMRVMTEETFGPLIPVMAFDSEGEAVRLANDSRFGLGASVWSRDVKRARLLADLIEAGMVWINDHTYSHGLAQTPWGGVKDSGLGVTHSKFGFYEMTEKRLVAEDRGRLPGGWWHPYSHEMRRGFDAVVDALYEEGNVLRLAWRRRGDIVPYLRDLLRGR